VGLEGLENTVLENIIILEICNGIYYTHLNGKKITVLLLHALQTIWNMLFFVWINFQICGCCSVWYFNIGNGKMCSVSYSTHSGSQNKNTDFFPSLYWEFCLGGGPVENQLGETTF